MPKKDGSEANVNSPSLPSTPRLSLVITRRNSFTPHFIESSQVNPIQTIVRVPRQTTETSPEATPACLSFCNGNCSVEVEADMTGSVRDTVSGFASTFRIASAEASWNPSRPPRAEWKEWGLRTLCFAPWRVPGMRGPACPGFSVQARYGSRVAGCGLGVGGWGLGLPGLGSKKTTNTAQPNAPRHKRLFCREEKESNHPSESSLRNLRPPATDLSPLSRLLAVILRAINAILNSLQRA